MMKSLVISALLLLVSVSGAWAGYPSTLVVLEKKDIVKLTDEQLTDAYVDTIVDAQARKDFFNRFGLIGKELDEYKAVMKYRILLLMEIHSRNLDIPQFERF
jgi:hypothetical protein